MSDIKLESFKPHYNDPDVSRIEEHFENIFNRIGAEDFSPTRETISEVIKQETDAIEKLVKKRFGFNIEIRNSKTFLATRVPAPKTISGVRDYRKIYRDAKDAIEKSKKNDYELIKFVKQVDELDDFLHLNALKVDFDKLYISNLPDSYRPTVYINFRDIVTRDNKFTFKELTAGFLHEIGHVFTFIAYSYRCRAKRLIFEEAIMDKSKVGKNGNAFLLAYEEAFQDKQFKNSDLRDPVVMLNVTKNIMDKMTEDLYMANSTDKEYMADAFVSSLGYAKYISSFLSKLEAITNYDRSVNGMITIIAGTAGWAIFFIVMYMVIFMLLLSPVIMLPVIMFFLSMILGIFLAALINVCIVLAVFGSNQKKIKVDYGTILERLERLRRDCVNNLNKLVNDGAEDEVIRMVLDEIESIKQDKEALKEKVGDSTIDKIVEFFMGWSSSYVESKELQALKDSIESLLYNDLYVSREKLKGVLK